MGWYRKTADQGHHLAHYRIGRQYASGRGVDQDHVNVLSRLVKAAHLGYVEAQCLVGRRDDPKALQPY
ncbi:hypothetical protein BKA57DRAFT_510083 [Linnemannia elongata]|nr:hypothetical protein BGZ88_002747 [Linnemannia elongata]KAH7036166.1 hypothetical protein BKA57DRAFT_510083 [Linnemannia elongata]